MLFNSSIRKELARTYAATLAVLLTIVITVMLIRTLSMASKGAVSPQDVMLVLGYLMLGYIPILLSLALFLTIVFVLARMYRDSEMIIWQSAGAGLLWLIRPVFRFSWAIVLGIAVLMLFVWPWSTRQITNIGFMFQQRSEINQIQPGQFQVSKTGNRVVFIEQQGNDDAGNDLPEGNNAFMLTNDFDAGKATIINAKSVHVETEDDDKFIVFNNGQQLELNMVNLDRTLLTFDIYRVLANSSTKLNNPAQKAKELSTEELLNDPTPANMGELSWRLGLIIACINLILIAIPLGHANPRTGRNTNLLYALLTFVIYFNLINLGRSWISSDKYSVLLVMSLIHGLMFVVALFFMLKQHYGWAIFPQWGRFKQKNITNKQEDTTVKKEQAVKLIKRSAGWGPLYTVRRLFYVEILAAIVIVALGFLSLFFFFDFIDDVGDMARKGYKFQHVLIRSLLQIPAHLYELMPIVVLIGTIFVLSRMAQSSEFTILRTSGLSPSRALKLLSVVGLIGALLTFILGDFLIPSANKATNRFMESFYASQESPVARASSAWLRDRDEQYTYIVNVNQHSEKQLRSIFIYQFDLENQLLRWAISPSATINNDGTWTLHELNISTLQNLGTDQAHIQYNLAPEYTWKNNLSSQMVSIATEKETGMSVWSLYNYIGHLTLNGQNPKTFEFSLWQKILYPFSCLVMVMLALPFAYLHFRSGGISTKVFGGIMIGISFVVINSMFGHLGQLQNWPPIISAGAPSLLYLLASLLTFGWLVRNR